MMQVGMLGKSSQGQETTNFVNQNYVYLNWSYEDELKYEREKSKNRQIVYEAAVEAVTHNYYAPNRVVDEAGLNKLKSMARDLEVSITKQDEILLKLEIDHIRTLQILDDEDVISLL